MARKTKRKGTKTITAPDGTQLVKSVIYTPPLPCDTPRERAAKSRATSAAQKKVNAKNALTALQMLIFGNFTASDYFVTLTYSDDNMPENRKAARANVQRYIKLLRAQRKRRGEELKYIYVTENKHGDGRYHHHIIINRCSEREYEELRSLWSWGTDIDIQPLFHDEITYIDRARYMTKESIENRPLDARLWTSSRNLVRPEYSATWISEDEALCTPTGARIIETAAEMNEYAQFQYIAYYIDPDPQPPAKRFYCRN